MKALKEIIIMLLICLIGILLFAVVFYEFIPARKTIAEVETYTANNTVKELLADNIDENNNNVITTYEEGNYEVTSKDLNNYEAANVYVPGKSNPFATIVQEESKTENKTSETNTDSNTDTNTNTKKSENTNKADDNNDSNTDNNTNPTYIRDNGTK